MSTKETVKMKSSFNPIRSSIQFFGEMKQELRKISWTSKKELLKYTKMVVSSMFVVGFVIYCVDLVIQRSLSFIQFLTLRIFG